MAMEAFPKFTNEEQLKTVMLDDFTSCLDWEETEGLAKIESSLRKFLQLCKLPFESQKWANLIWPPQKNPHRFLSKTDSWPEHKLQNRVTFHTSLH
uniref:Uncharacterized protein n=1 Tax=Anguilla anguilla TaxID=7936 RepID=A0A0E9WDB7_ANGAN